MSTQPATVILPLTSDWRMVRREPGSDQNPADIDWQSDAVDATVPGTVASTLLRQFDPGKLPDINYDDYDWWYQSAFTASPQDFKSMILQFEGLATIAEVWLNDELILTSRNMFRSWAIDVTDSIQASNTLVIVFRSVTHDLGTKRPRGRWKTNLVPAQQLRWIRTTLLGRIPGWTPAIQPVGPWRSVSLHQGNTVSIESFSIRTETEAKRCTANVNVVLHCLDSDDEISAAKLSILGKDYPLSLDRTNQQTTIRATIDIDNVPLWFAHNYGKPELHEYCVSVKTSNGDTMLKHGKLGFRQIRLDRSDGLLAFTLNDKKIFAQGACWSTNDIISLDGDADRLRATLTLFRDAGGNMLRVGGTMVYESDLFYDLCDELGITVWQDFMFANMDYPSDDENFLADVIAEIEQQLERLKAHPCVIACCGNSEVEQQAAMFGMTQDVWRNDLFYKAIPDAIGRIAPGMPYFPSSPCEGALPFHNSTGPAHYFGVGAYKQPYDDLHKSDVKFATECLAFSNMPCDESLRTRFGTTAPLVHQPAWKAGVPRDSSAGWDFEDIRDHYISRLYGIDPVALRYYDKERYAALSQVVTGEVMQHAFNTWKSRYSRCSGALTWFLNDIVPGAGWGFIDSDGKAKPAYYFLRRCWSDTRLHFRDSGMDGAQVVISNDSDSDLDATVRVQVIKNAQQIITETSYDVCVASGAQHEMPVDQALGRFYDTENRYRFGPPKHDVIVATLRTRNGTHVTTSSHIPQASTLPVVEKANVVVTTESVDDSVRLHIQSDSFLQNVKLFSKTHTFGDNYFDLAPDCEVTIQAQSVSGQPFRGILSALNLAQTVNCR